MKSNELRSSNWEDVFGKEAKVRRHPRNLEHGLQSRCVSWFRLQFPNRRHNLFAVPNGGYRTKTTAALLKDEGQLSGVADLILLVRKGTCGALLLEAKVKGNYQSPNQKLWQKMIEADGYEYRIFHTIEEFASIVTEYLSRAYE